MGIKRKTAALLAATGALMIALAPAASAHVRVSSADATQGGYGILTFRVPTESDTASTTGLKVQFPADQPLASVDVKPSMEWTYTVTKAKLATPIKTDDGELTEAVSEIDWSATSGGIKPGEFDQFSVLAGPLPKASKMTFKAIQLYSDGTSVDWTEVPAAGSTAEPEHPAPVLTLAAAPSTTATPAASGAADSGDYASKSVATAGLVVGIVGVLLALAALVFTARRRSVT